MQVTLFSFLDFSLYSFLLGGITEHSARSVEAISESWNLIWEIAFSGPLFAAMTNLGITISVLCIAFLLIEMGKNLLSDMNLQIFVSHLLWPLIASLFFSNHGFLLKEGSLLIRDFINTANVEIIESIAASETSISFDGALAQISDFDSILDKITSFREQCDSFTNFDQMESCLEEVESMSYELRDEYEKKYPDESEWIQVINQNIELNRINPKSLSQRTKDVLIGTGNVIINSAGGGFVGITRKILGDGEVLIKTLLYSFQIAIQHLIEVSMLLTALMSPIALGASLFPMPTKPIVAWITAFLSLGMFKLSYNVVVGLTAVAMVQNDYGPSNTMPMAIALAVLSPVLAFGIASGGGLAIFNGIAQVGGAVASLGIRAIKVNG